MEKRGMVLPLMLMALIPSVRAQTFFDTYQMQQIFQSSLMAWVLWFLLIFSIVFFSAKIMFHKDQKTATMFSIVVSLMGTYGILNAYPNIMETIGIYVPWFLGAAILLLLIAWFRKGGGSIDVNVSGLGSLFNIWVFSIGYLLLWGLIKFTSQLLSVKNALANYWGFLDIIAMIDAAGLIIYGLMKLNAHAPLDKGKILGQLGSLPEGPAKERFMDSARQIENLRSQANEAERMEEKAVGSETQKIDNAIAEARRSLEESKARGGIYARQLGDKYRPGKTSGQWEDLIFKLEARKSLLKSGDRVKYNDELRKIVERRNALQNEIRKQEIMLNGEVNRYQLANMEKTDRDKKTIGWSSTFEQLSQAIIRNNVKFQAQTPEAMVGLINEVKAGRKDIRFIPETYGLREKVRELLVKEKRAFSEDVTEMIAKADNFSDIERIIARQDLKSGNYDSQQLVTLVRDAKRGAANIDSVPEQYGLREKVGRFVEFGRRYNEDKRKMQNRKDQLIEEINRLNSSGEGIVDAMNNQIANNPNVNPETIKQFQEDYEKIRIEQEKRRKEIEGLDKQLRMLEISVKTVYH